MGRRVMLIYLDSVVVIYAVEGAPALQARAKARLSALHSAGDELATSDLSRLECLIQPLRKKDVALMAVFLRFLGRTKLLPLPGTVSDNATEIRAIHNYSTLDSLHLAAALAGGCGAFLTNDSRLAGFHDLAVEMLA